MVDSNESTTVVETSPSVQTAANHSSSEHALRALRMLFRIAEGYWERQEIRQAMELYTEIHEKYGDMPEAEPAEEKLLEIAEWFEAQGSTHQARALAERLI